MVTKSFSDKRTRGIVPNLNLDDKEIFSVHSGIVNRRVFASA
jgi:hypothetical protein